MGERVLSERVSRGVIRHVAERFGTSVRGVPLEVYLPTQHPPRYLILAAQHGDEPESLVLLSHALRAVEACDLAAAVVLAMNPDGLLLGTRGNANGVDLNRNFPTKNWGSAPIVYRWSSEFPRDVQLSAGVEAASEPETKALLGLIERVKPEAVISIHAPLACIDDPKDSALGRWLADATELPLVADVGFPTPGSFGTWCSENGSRSVITFELAHESNEAIRRRCEAALIEVLCGSVP